MSALAKPICELDYLTLVRRFPLRPIHTDAVHRGAVEMAAELTAKGDAELSAGEIDYLQALARFIDDYQKQRRNVSLQRATPLEVLRHLMEEREMTPAQLGDILGSRPAASMILKGRREMSKAHIRAAATHFAVSPAVFL